MLILYYNICKLKVKWCLYCMTFYYYSTYLTFVMFQFPSWSEQIMEISSKMIKGLN